MREEDGHGRVCVREREDCVCSDVLDSCILAYFIDWKCRSVCMRVPYLLVQCPQFNIPPILPMSHPKTPKHAYPHEHLKITIRHNPPSPRAPVCSINQIPITVSFTWTPITLTGAAISLAETSLTWRVARHDLLVRLSAPDVVAHVVVLRSLRRLAPLEGGGWMVLRVEGCCGGHVMVGFSAEGAEGDVG